MTGTSFTLLLWSVLLVFTTAQLGFDFEFCDNTIGIQCRNVNASNCCNNNICAQECCGNLSCDAGYHCCPGSKECCSDLSLCCGDNCCINDFKCCPGNEQCCTSLSKCCGKLCCPEDSMCCPNKEDCCKNDQKCCDNGGCCPKDSSCCGEYCCPSYSKCCADASGCYIEGYHCCGNGVACPSGYDCCGDKCCSKNTNTTTSFIIYLTTTTKPRLTTYPAFMTKGSITAGDSNIVGDSRTFSIDYRTSRVQNKESIFDPSDFKTWGFLLFIPLGCIIMVLGFILYCCVFRREEKDGKGESKA
ncbi:hypothetical protein CHS0354_021405 [Potamilus streckersoni]|uniref:Uncharacterized protein n=1 Tax=Potamilus streckersoni TaxID=2493646 RepID=A0AAE0VMT0_9BIVA|nr:hypothetical protein CHS0354_021405 [Potamilus streckersoni]